MVEAGETVRVRCSAGSTPGSLTIEWSRLAGSLPSVRECRVLRSGWGSIIILYLCFVREKVIDNTGSVA